MCPSECVRDYAPTHVAIRLMCTSLKSSCFAGHWASGWASFACACHSVLLLNFVPYSLWFLWEGKRSLSRPKTMLWGEGAPVETMFSVSCQPEGLNSIGERIAEAQ